MRTKEQIASEAYSQIRAHAITADHAGGTRINMGLVARYVGEAVRDVRRNTIEECAKVADRCAEDLDNEWNRKLSRFDVLIETCEEIAEDIRDLLRE